MAPPPRLDVWTRLQAPRLRMPQQRPPCNGALLPQGEKRSEPLAHTR
eukprot:CAMPEP_0204391182 /NCGR_PEP_ID=MMETSP0469-20131031/61122_1 /ASSEMBLY_ACC=CAM_ASM_000384 /TAXON_ID=2969 /ORGANISM="Oxyrrhis marina" /LENGTH=46 /DNA_ID= /DNA_START= /DNA_END= /DNA_ORIENTATION=